MSIKIFADSADLAKMRDLSNNEGIAGWTTNPTLMRLASVTRFRAFAIMALKLARGKPVSIQVTADDFDQMEVQAREIVSLGKNALVKVPVMNSRGRPSTELITRLVEAGVPLNVTAVFTEEQVTAVGEAMSAAKDGGQALIVSVFAGRIADTGVDPAVHVKKCRAALKKACSRAEMLWASSRQAYDAVLAEKAGCEIITMDPSLIAKLGNQGRDLDDFSRDTVYGFFQDAQEAGYSL